MIENVICHVAHFVFYVTTNYNSSIVNNMSIFFELQTYKFKNLVKTTFCAKKELCAV